jgi:NADPH:quinone reductase-like Zn-dependent oxidoreductase
VRRGGYAERAVVRAGDLLHLPAGLSFAEGAAIPLGFATAYAALVRYGGALPGERVLIHGVGGGVGSAATIVAKAEGLEVWGTASPGKHDALRALGVDHPVDYTAVGWERDLPSFDLIMDALGGKSFRRSYQLLRAGGRLICYGASGVLKGERRNVVTALRTLVRTPRFNPMKQIQHSKTVIGLDTIAVWEEKGSLAELLQPLAPLVASGKAKPPVAATFPFGEV